MLRDDAVQMPRSRWTFHEANGFVVITHRREAGAAVASASPHTEQREDTGVPSSINALDCPQKLDGPSCGRFRVSAEIDASVEAVTMYYRRSHGPCEGPIRIQIHTRHHIHAWLQ